MGCTESAPDAPAFNVPIQIHTSIPPLNPNIPPSNATTEIIVNEKLFSWSGDDFLIKTKSGEEFHGMHIQGKTFGFCNQMTLLDDNNKPIAVCLRQYDCLKQVFKIYTFQQLYPGQSKSDHDYKGMALYTYAKVVRRLFDSIQDVILDDREIPSFTIHRVGNLWPKKRTMEYHNRPAALIEGRTWVGNCNSYVLTIKPGVDPCLVVCVTAICDEMDEDE